MEFFSLSNYWLDLREKSNLTCCNPFGSNDINEWFAIWQMYAKIGAYCDKSGYSCAIIFCFKHPVDRTYIYGSCTKKLCKRTTYDAVLGVCIKWLTQSRRSTLSPSSASFVVLCNRMSPRCVAFRLRSDQNSVYKYTTYRLRKFKVKRTRSVDSQWFAVHKRLGMAAAHFFFVALNMPKPPIHHRMHQHRTAHTRDASDIIGQLNVFNLAHSTCDGTQTHTPYIHILTATYDFE